MAIHAIGDKANDRVLELAEMVENENGMRDRRFRVNNLNLWAYVTNIPSLNVLLNIYK